MNFMNVVKSITAATKKRSPELLIGVGIGGMIAAIVTAVRATGDMNKDIEKVKEETKEMPKKERQKEVVKTVAKHQWPTAVIFSLSLLAIVSADKIHCKRNAAMAVMVQAAEVATQEYRNVVREVAGEEKAKEVERIYEERVRDRPIEKEPNIIINGEEYWIFDELTNTMFRSNTLVVDAAVNECNARMHDEMYVSLKEFYDEMCIDSSQVNSAVGWNNNIGLIRIKWEGKMIKGKPCAVLKYTNPPKEGFRESW
jgi:hypothetical protein